MSESGSKPKKTTDDIMDVSMDGVRAFIEQAESGINSETASDEDMEAACIGHKFKAVDVSLRTFVCIHCGKEIEVKRTKVWPLDEG